MKDGAVLKRRSGSRSSPSDADGAGWQSRRSEELVASLCKASSDKERSGLGKTNAESGVPDSAFAV
jgi:hypothetical protein